MNKSIDKLTPEEQEVADAYIESVRARCYLNKMTVTLWLLFDTATHGNGFVRSRMLRDFKKYATTNSRPRSVSEGAKWLAVNAWNYYGN